MASITVEKHINAPVETVFAHASDVHNWANQVEAIMSNLEKRAANYQD